MPRHAANIFRLGVKELWSLARDPMMLVLIFVSFTLMIYTAATAVPLIGRISCGQAENAMTRSISARSLM